MSEQITQRFIEAFNEEQKTIDFTSWEQRFKITSIQIANVSKQSKDWNIFLRDTKRPYTDFTLFIEDGNLIHFTMDS